MKYATYLSLNAIPEWRSFYLNYRKLKKELKRYTSAIADCNTSHPAEIPNVQKAYIALLNEELDRVNQFYEEKEAELIKQFNQLKSILAESWDGNSEIPSDAKYSPNTNNNVSSSVLSSSSSSSAITHAPLESSPSLRPLLSSSNGDSPSSSPSLDRRANFSPSPSPLASSSSSSLDIESGSNSKNKGERKGGRTHSMPPAPRPSLERPKSMFLPSPNKPIVRKAKTITNPEPVKPKIADSPIPSNSTNAAWKWGLSPQKQPIRDAEPSKPYLPHAAEYRRRDAETDVITAARFRYTVKRALEEQYRELTMLKDFVTHNSMGFIKVIKKHDKIPGAPSLALYLDETMYKSHFYTSDALFFMINDIEVVYSNLFTGKNDRQAVDKLRIPSQIHHHDWVTYRFGLFTGACIILILYLAGNSPNIVGSGINNALIANVFRGLGIPILFAWTFAFVTIIWDLFGVNYVFIFGWDPRTYLRPHNLLELSSGLSLIWLCTFCGYYQNLLGQKPYSQITGAAYPFALLCVLFLFLIFPLNMFYRSTRAWLFQTILRVIKAPFLPVKFKEFFVTNQLTSLKNSFSDIGDAVFLFTVSVWQDNPTTSEWLHASLIYRPIMQSVPSFWRALQCIRRYQDSNDSRHLVNAIKYFSSVLTVVFSGIRRANQQSHAILITYSFIAAISALYTWIWDVRVDWGLGNWGSRSHFMLREQLIYKKVWVYYLGIIVNLALRLVWVVTLGIPSTNAIMTTASVTEVILRFTWNIFRLENEHLKNTDSINAASVLPELIAQYQELHSSSKGGSTNVWREENLGHEKDKHSIFLIEQVMATRKNYKKDNTDQENNGVGSKGAVQV